MKTIKIVYKNKRYESASSLAKSLHISKNCFSNLILKIKNNVILQDDVYDIDKSQNREMLYDYIEKRKLNIPGKGKTKVFVENKIFNSFLEFCNYYDRPTTSMKNFLKRYKIEKENNTYTIPAKLYGYFENLEKREHPIDIKKIKINNNMTDEELANRISNIFLDKLLKYGVLLYIKNHPEKTKQEIFDLYNKLYNYKG